MIKKALSLFLSILIVLSLGTSALAGPAPEMPSDAASDSALDERLSKVTLVVKNTLGIGDEFTSFHGTLNDRGIKQIWSLNWSGETVYLSVNTDETGKIYNYSRNQNDRVYRYYDSFSPKFPSVTRDQAQAVAEAFLKKVLGKNESCVLENQSAVMNPNQTDNYYFNSMLKLNGLDSPIYISISVSAEDLAVSYFHRSDMGDQTIGTVPSADPVTTKAKAAELLAGTVKMKLQYVLNGMDTDQKTRIAELQYLPIRTGNYVVNAKTGKLINIDDIYKDINTGGGYGTAEAAADTADMLQSKASLTEAEREGIEQLAGTLTKQQLDEKARAITEFGLLSGYALNNVSYSLNRETSEVTAFLSYTLKINPKNEGTVTFVYKTVTLDAKTGVLKSLYTSYPYNEDYSKLERDSAALQGKAKAFLSKYYKENFEKTALYEDTESVIPYSYYDYKRYSPAESLVFSQIENGYFFPANALYISVNAETGYIDSFSMNWTDDIRFESAEGIISNEKACSLFAGAHDTKLSYISLPVAIDPTRPDLKPYAELGYSYVYETILGYTNTSANYIYGVHAKTGKVLLVEPWKEQEPARYSDITGLYAEAQIKKLAQYGVGFPGDKFKPEKQLTQLDMVLLLMSADGYRLDHDNLTEEEIDNLYSSAYYRNILTKKDKDPTKIMTRSDLIRTLLTMSGYNKTADLKGIYRCKFKDEATIKEADYGYFAIAQGLGIINGDGKGNANPYAKVTRVEAAMMLYNFMSR